ncbi:MAG: Rrf2 family transcriptional regulator [Candidatus Omnitrophota bacterium]
MKLINRDTDYAVRALCVIAREGGRLVSVTRLVKGLKIPRPFLRKILQVLNKKGILKSRKGKRGGFRLNFSLEKILLTDLIEAFQGPLRLNECIFKKKICPDRGACVLRMRISAIEEYVVSELKAITLASLV